MSARGYSRSCASSVRTCALRISVFMAPGKQAPPARAACGRQPRHGARRPIRRSTSCRKSECRSPASSGATRCAAGKFVQKVTIASGLGCAPPRGSSRRCRRPAPCSRRNCRRSPRALRRRRDSRASRTSADDLGLIGVVVRRDEADGLDAALAQHAIEREHRGRRRDAGLVRDALAQVGVGIEAEAHALAAVPADARRRCACASSRAAPSMPSQS